jgi:L-2,4-diaminobutyrate decarboxylase
METVWDSGFSGDMVPVLLVGEDSHYSVFRAAGILGMGTANVVKIPLTEKYKMDPAALKKQIELLRRDGIPIAAVVASACSTRTGIFDSLREISSVCKQYGIWLHVDAAHGGSVSFSDSHKHYLDGIEDADSVIWDAHKMLFMPALSTYLFYKDFRNQYIALNQHASYLFNSDADDQRFFDTGLGTIECTKRAAAFSLWGTWSIYGNKLFEDLVNTTFDVARQFAVKMIEHNDFDLLIEPESNIILFRYIPNLLRKGDIEEIGKFQTALRSSLIKSGSFYIVMATHDNYPCLRVVIMNPLTHIGHFQLLADELGRRAEEIIKIQNL